MQAIILAGGFGTRLKSTIGEEIPKPMAPIRGEPFLAHYLRYLAGQGVTEAVLSTHHLGAVIHNFFGDRFESVMIRYAEEKTPLGTGGAVRYALEQLRADEPVLVTNGDSFLEIQIPKLMEAHRQAGTTLSIALREMPDCSRYGEVSFNADHRITDFRYPGRPQPGYISTGVYAVSPNIFSAYKLPEAFSFEADFQRPYLAQVQPLAWVTKGYFIDIGIPDDYARAERELLDHIPKKKAA